MQKARKYRTGLIIGRFQPFHKGHLYAVKYALGLCSKLVIGIGSAQEKGTSKNPFSAKEREKMIKETLEKEGISPLSFSFLLIPDFFNDEKWLAFILRHVKPEVVFSRNPVVKKIFRKAGIKVIRPPWYKREKISGTRIRSLMESGKSFEELVPEPVAKLVTSTKYQRTSCR